MPLLSQCVLLMPNTIFSYLYKKHLLQKTRIDLHAFWAVYFFICHFWLHELRPIVTLYAICQSCYWGMLLIFQNSCKILKPCWFSDVLSGVLFCRNQYLQWHSFYCVIYSEHTHMTVLEVQASRLLHYLLQLELLHCQVTLTTNWLSGVGLETDFQQNQSYLANHKPLPKMGCSLCDAFFLWLVGCMSFKLQQSRSSIFCVCWYCVLNSDWLYIHQN